MARQVTDYVIGKLKQWEGCRLNAYRDAGGVLTIGYGHTGPDVVSGLAITQERAEALLRRDLARFEAAVDHAVRVSLSDNQFGALVSFAFNVGIGAFQGSTLLKRLNAGDYDEVPRQLNKWINVAGRPNRGLVNRRAAEIGLWNKGAFVASNTVPAEPKTTKSGIQLAQIGSGAAALGVAASGAAEQLAPASHMDWIRPLFAALLVLGVCGGLIGAMLARRQDAA